MVVHVGHNKSVCGTDCIVSEDVLAFCLLRVHEECLYEEVVRNDVVVEHNDLRQPVCIDLLNDDIESAIFIDIKEGNEFTGLSRLRANLGIVLGGRGATAKLSVVCIGC